ncbi:hypothetical protein K8Q98_00715, partial [Candidatus Nomurabacteria bacterium]|nr:hypothetical protein [Candidatus Nomurabacteria bacterium]
VYCKECMEKIKTGELKSNSNPIRERKQDEAKFYRPLADLGIEFQQKDSSGEDKTEEPKGVFSSIKKIFKPGNNKNNHKNNGHKKENFALRDALNKLTKDGEISMKDNQVSVAVKPMPEPISLDALKDKTPIADSKPKEVISSLKKDRSASQEEMNKLKDLISAVDETPKEVATPESTPTPTPAPTQSSTEESRVQEPPLTKGNIKEVPEDVLRKILE